MLIASKIVWMLISSAYKELFIRVATHPLAFIGFSVSFQNAVNHVGFSDSCSCSRVSCKATILGDVSSSNFCSSGTCA